MAVNVGEFKYSIDIVKVIPIVDDRGMKKNQDHLLIKKRCKVKRPSLQKQELYKQLGDVITESLEFTFRKYIDIEYDHIVIFGGHRFNIKGINEIDDKYHNILCVKVQ